MSDIFIGASKLGIPYTSCSPSALTFGFHSVVTFNALSYSSRLGKKPTLLNPDFTNLIRISPSGTRIPCTHSCTLKHFGGDASPFTPQSPANTLPNSFLESSPLLLSHLSLAATSVTPGPHLAQSTPNLLRKICFALVVVGQRDPHVPVCPLSAHRTALWSCFAPFHKFSSSTNKTPICRTVSLAHYNAQSALHPYTISLQTSPNLPEHIGRRNFKVNGLDEQCGAIVLSAIVLNFKISDQKLVDFLFDHAALP